MQHDIGDLWRDHRRLQEARKAILSMVERTVSVLQQLAAASSLRRLVESSARAEASIKGCQATIDDVRASVDADRLQLSNVSFSLDNLGQRVCAVARQEATIAKACECIAQEIADIQRATAPLEQVTTLQRVVTGWEPKIGSLEGHYENLKFRQAAVIEQVGRTAGLLDVVPRLR